jgi:hypothetical protein
VRSGDEEEARGSPRELIEAHMIFFTITSRGGTGVKTSGYRLDKILK